MNKETKTIDVSQMQETLKIAEEVKASNEPRDLHSDSQAIQQRLIADRSAWFTSNFIVAEAHALFLTRLGIRAAVQFLDRIELSSVTVIRVTPGDEARAKAIVRQYDDKDFSFTDAS